MLIQKIHIDEESTVEIIAENPRNIHFAQICITERRLLNSEEYDAWEDGDTNERVLPVYQENTIDLFVGYPALQEMILALQKRATELKPLHLKEKARIAKLKKD